MNPPPWMDWTATVLVFIAGTLYLGMALFRVDAPKGPLLVFRGVAGIGFLFICSGWFGKLLENGDLLTLATTEIGVLLNAGGGLLINLHRHLTGRKG